MNLLSDKFLRIVASVISLMLIASIISVNVFADDKVVEAGYNENKGLVRVYSGMNAKNANKPVSVWIIKNGDMYYAYQTDAATDGSVDLAFYLNDTVSYDDFIADYVLKSNINGNTYTIEPSILRDLEITKLDWDVDTKVLTVNGICLFDGEIKLTVSDSSPKVICEETIYPDGDRFEYSLSLADQSYGKFNVKVTDVGETLVAEDSFSYKSPENVIAELKAVPTGENFAAVLKEIENLKALGVASWANSEGDGFMDLSIDTYSIMSKAYENLKDAASVTNEAEKASLVNALNNASDVSEAENILLNVYKKNLINKDKYPLIAAYDNLSDYEKEEAISAVTAKGIESFAEFDSIMAENILIPQINSIKISSVLASLVSKYSDYFDIKGTLNASEYAKVINAAPYVEIKDFVKKCNDIIDERKNKDSSPKSSSPIGGGGAGISNIKVESAVKEQETKQEIFNDLNDTLWAKTAIEALYAEGIVAGVGDGKFNPNGLVKREELVKMLVGALKLNCDKHDAIFADAMSGEWYNPYINAAYDAGITTGKPDGTFGIGENVTRQDTAVFLWRSFKNLSQIEVDAKPPFADEKRISDYAVEAVTGLHNLGIINGVGDNKFMPADVCTRAEAAQMIYTVMVYGKGGN